MDEPNDTNDITAKKKKKLDESGEEKRPELADRLVNAMAANLEKAMLIDEDERLRLERAREERLDRALGEPLPDEPKTKPPKKKQ